MSERIECAAIRCGGDVFEAPRPGRHHDVIRMMADLGLGPGQMHDQGFTTSAGRFVDRVEGLRIAQDAGQIIEKTEPSSKLFSEDMW